MAVEKAITFDDLANEGTDAEKREGFKRGGFRGRRSGRMGSVRGARSRSRSKSKGGFKGRRSARGASVKGAKTRAAKAAKAKAATSKSISRRQQGQVSTPQASVAAAPQSTTKSTQAQTRKGTTTTAAAVSRAVADKQNKMGTKYAGNLQKAIADANKRAFDRSLEGRKLAAAQANVTAAAQNPNLRAGTFAGDLATRAEISRMDTLRGNLLEKAKRNQISTAELSRLADMNRAIGLNPTTGMGLVESMRFNTKDVNLGDIAKLAGFVANPGLAIATGGKGILGLLGNLKEGVGTALGFGESPQQMVSNPNLREGTMATQRPGFLSGIASALRLGEGPGFTEERGGGRGREPLLPITPPVPPTTGGLFGKIPAGIPIKKAVTPVGTAVTEDAINEYLRLAGFNI
jgi:hypothetical protein